MNAVKTAGEDSTGAISVLGTPTDFFTLCVGDGRVGFGRGPDAKILKEVSLVQVRKFEEKVPEILLTSMVWHNESWFCVVELHLL